MSSMGLTARQAAGFACHAALTASVTLGTGAVRCRAQDIPTAVQALRPARVELYGAYAYFHPLGGTVAARRYDSIQPGAAGSASYYFNRYLGAQVEGGAFPQGGNDSVGTIGVGPVLRYPFGRTSPFVHVLIGGVRQRGPLSQPPTYGFSATAGAGLDYVVPGFENRLAIRLAQADFHYTHVNDGTTAQPGEALGEIKAYRFSAGVVLRFGGIAEERQPPLRYSCAASPVTIFAGDPVTVTGTTAGATPGKRSVFTWATNGGQILATEETVNIATAGLPPGEYTITGHILQGKHPGEIADCTTGYTVQPPQPPAISCSADPVSVASGGKATVTSRATSPQNRPLSFAYSASAGEISSTVAVATLNAGDAPPGPINVECRVIDDLGQSATAMAMVIVSVVFPASPAATLRPELCTLNFARDRKHPVHLDDEAKTCLNDVALTLKQEATARLAITGEHSQDESAGHAAARALYARRYLIGQGIDPAQIELKTGTLTSRTAEMKLLLPGEPFHDSDGTEGSRGVPVVGPIQGLNRAVPQALPDDKAVPAPPVAPSLEGPGGGGFRPSPKSVVPPPLPADATVKSVLGTRPRPVHRKKHRTRHRATVATKTPVPSGSGER